MVAEIRFIKSEYQRVKKGSRECGPFLLIRNQIIAEIVESDVATKQDIRELRDEMLKLEYRLIIKVGFIVISTTSIAVGLLAWLIK